MANIQAWTIDELKAIIENATNDRERLMIKVAFWHALRASELCKLTGKSVRDGVLDLQRLKGSFKTTQEFIRDEEINDPALCYRADLMKLAAETGDRDFLFPELQGKSRPVKAGAKLPGDPSRFRFHYIIVKAATKAGLPKHKRHPHCLKHTMGKIAIKAGIEYARQWLGHKSVASTGEYIRVHDSEARAGLVGVLPKVMG